MHSTDYQTDANENLELIYTTEQWFRSLQVRKMDCDRDAKPIISSSERVLLPNDFFKIWLTYRKTHYFGSKIAGQKYEARTQKIQMHRM